MLPLLLSAALASPDLSTPLLGDLDGDAVADPVDRCPDQPGPIGEDLSVADGCPKGAWFQGMELRFSGRLDFEPGTARLAPSAGAVLEELRARLAEQPSVRRVEVQGHTDNSGDPDASLRLSDERALAVVAHLQAAGIGADRMVARGWGGTRPLFSNRTPQGREQNQRIQIVILEGRPAPPGPPGLLDLRLASGGWATVAVDGKRLPQTAPLRGWSLPAGSHRLQVENPLTRVSWTSTVEIGSDQTTEVVVPAPGASAP